MPTCYLSVIAVCLTVCVLPLFKYWYSTGLYITFRCILEVNFLSVFKHWHSAGLQSMSVSGSGQWPTEDLIQLLVGLTPSDGYSHVM